MTERMTRRQVLRYLTAGAAGAALAACQPQVVEKIVEVEKPVEVEKIVEVEKEVIKEVEVERVVEPTPVPRQLVEIRVTHAWPAEQWPRQQQFDELFNAEHEWVRVQGENVVWGDYVPKITAAAAARTLPDVLYCQFAWAQRFIMDGIVINLQPFLDNDPEFWGENGEDFVPQALETYRWQGDMYLIPYNEGPTNLIYYNIRLFDEAGIPYPHSDKDWTLDDMLEVARELTFGEGEDKVWGYDGLPNMGGALNADFLKTWDAYFWSEPCETQSGIDSENAIACLQWWADLRLKHRVVPTPAEAETIPGNPFFFGRIAMLKGASWTNRSIRPNLKDPYDVAHGPVGPNGKRSSSTMGSAYAISSDTPHREAAWEYLRAYLSTEGQIFNFSSIGIDPARWSAWPAYFETDATPPNAIVVKEAFETYAVHEVLDSPHGREITLTAQPFWDRALLGEISVEEACLQIHEAVTPVMALNEEWCQLAGLAES